MIKQGKKPINLVNQITTKINQINVIKKNQIILISLSGGQDSVSIFFILLHLKKQWNWSFGIIYCNHLWQQNAFYTSCFILKIASIFYIPMYCLVTPITIFNECQSRYWRYDVFYRISFFYNYEFISTGHTSSDKIETILFQLIRGTSPKSLTSFYEIKHFYCINTFSKNNTKAKIQYIYFDIKLKNDKKTKLCHFNYASKTFRKNNFKYDIKSNKTKKNNNKTVFIKTTISAFELSLYNKIILKQLKCVLIKFSKKTKELQNKVLNAKLHNFNKNVTKFFLIRPVLYLNRFEIKKIVILWKLPLYPDKSNKEKLYYRNRIRKHLLPTLRFFLNPQIDTTLTQFTDIILAEQNYLHIVTNRLKYEFLIQKNKNFFNLECSIELNISLFYGIPLALQRKLIKKFLENYTNQDVQFEKIEQIVKIVRKKKFFIFNRVIPIISGISYCNHPFINTRVRDSSLPYLNPVKLSENLKNKTQNVFQFKKSIKKEYLSKNSTEKQSSLYNNISNKFLTTYYFKKFQLFFYPKIGILFFFKNKLIFFQV